MAFINFNLEFNTTKISLKPIVATFELAKTIFDVISENREFYKYTPVATIQDKVQMFGFLKNAQKEKETRTKATYIMYNNNVFVGMCYVFNIDLYNKTAEIGCWGTPQATKLGLVSHAFTVLSNKCFDNGFRRITTSVDSKNIDAYKVAENSGFIRNQMVFFTKER